MPDIKQEPMAMAFDVTTLTPNNPRHTSIPDKMYNARETFGLDIDWEVPGFSHDMPNVPTKDETYQFDHDTTLALLAGFAFNRRVMIDQLIFCVLKSIEAVITILLAQKVLPDNHLRLSPTLQFCCRLHPKPSVTK